MTIAQNDVSLVLLHPDLDGLGKMKVTIGQNGVSLVSLHPDLDGLGKTNHRCCSRLTGVEVVVPCL